jgi:hypothetical protein
MKLEFLSDTALLGNFSDEVNEQLIRLYDFDAAEAEKFCHAITQTLINKKSQLDIHTLEFIEVVNCTLSLHITDSDEGIRFAGGDHFICELTLESYRNIINLCLPFCGNKSRGFTWLYHLDIPIDFLFSPRGTW